jgi:multiple sugar transport system ATP-binding protein
MTLAKHIVVMSQGIVQQVGAPLELYRRPANTFVAGFIGSPAMNFFTVDKIDGRLRGKGVDWPVPAELASSLPAALTVGIRPEHLHAARDGDLGRVKLRVDVLEPLGAEVMALGEVEGQPVTAKLDPDTPARAGELIELGVELDHLHLFDRASGRSVRA